MFTRPAFDVRHLPGYAVLMIVCAAVFLLQTVFQYIPATYYQGRDLLSALFILDRPDWHALNLTLFYRMFTYAFLHENFLHLLFNMIVLMFTGKALEERIGRGSFIVVYCLAAYFCGIVTALHGVLVFWNPWSMVLGASGAISALLFVYWRLNPDAEILLFFILPLPIRYVMLGLMAVDFAGTFIPLGNHLSHVTHLAGYGFGYLYLRYGGQVVLFWEKLLHKKQARMEIRHFEKQLERQQRFENEIDPILKKISEQGADSLTDIERRILQNAGKKR